MTIKDVIVADVLLTRAQIVSAKYLVDLLRIYEPVCTYSFEGARSDPETFAYQLRFLVDAQCLAAKFWHEDEPVIEDEVEL